MSKPNERPWLSIALGLLCIAAIAVAYTTVGQASQGSAQGTRTAVAQRGVVQSTVSGSGNVQAASQLDLGFKTDGTVTHIYVTEGQRVVRGQLLATLDPQSAEVTLEQAKASLKSAEAGLAEEEENDGETASAQSSAGQGSTAQASTASAASVGRDIAYTMADTASATAPAQTAATTPTVTTPTATTPATTPPTASTSPTTTTAPAAKGKSQSAKTTHKKASTAPKASETSSGQSSGSSSSSSGVSSATRAANLASAKAAVKSDRLTVASDEQAVQDTKLYAPQDGTIVTLSGEVGETVSATGTTKASSASSSSADSGSSTGATAGGSSPSGSTGSSSSSSSSSSSGSSFAVLSDLSSMQLVVPLSESEIGHVKVGQTATVTIEALSSHKVAAHVVAVDALATSNSGVVSYDVTFQLDQGEAGLKVGMSATAEVVVRQAEGVNVPTTAISAGTVTVVRDGRQVSQAVTTGLAGDSSTIVLSGLKAGEEVVLPSATSTTTGSSDAAIGSRIGGRLAGGGLGGLGGGGALRSGGPPGG